MKLMEIGPRIWQFLVECEAYSGRRIQYFGVFGFFAYSVFYFINKNVITTQTYENIHMRIAASILCFFLIFKNYWPKSIRPYFPLYWFITILYGLPFFFVYMLLRNNFSSTWLLNLLTVIFFTILVLDWKNAIIVFIIGIPLAFVAYKFTAPLPFTFTIKYLRYSDFIAAYIVTVLLGVLFSRDKEMVFRERLEVLKSTGMNLSHEFRTILASIDIKLKLLLKNASEKKIVLGNLSKSVSKLRLETKAGATFIDMMLTNLGVLLKDAEVKPTSMKEVVESAIERYPFQPGQREKVHFDLGKDFIFNGDMELMVHVFFNLFKNALYYIAKKSDPSAQIYISIVSDNKNRLIFRDTGAGIARRDVRKVFDRFFSRTYHGTGIGLSFCKDVVLRFGGKIKCFSEFGEYAEFVISFPK